MPLAEIINPLAREVSRESDQFIGSHLTTLSWDKNEELSSEDKPLVDYLFGPHRERRLKPINGVNPPATSSHPLEDHRRPHMPAL